MGYQAAKVTPPWREYRRVYHTSTEELAAIAKDSQPKLLVLYHRANPGCDQVGTNCGTSGSEEEALDEVRRSYSGQVVDPSGRLLHMNLLRASPQRRGARQRRECGSTASLAVKPSVRSPFVTTPASRCSGRATAWRRPITCARDSS